MRCDECRFWGGEDMADPFRLFKLRECARIVDAAQAHDAADRLTYIGRSAFTQDGAGDFYSSLWTAPHHFCAMFQAKEG